MKKYFTYRVNIQNNSMQTKGLQHPTNCKFGQCCSPCSAVGIVAVRTADDHSQACVKDILDQDPFIYSILVDVT